MSDAVAAALAAVPVPDGGRVRAARDDDADGLLALVGGAFAEYDGCVLDPEGLDADLFAWATHLAAAGGAGWVVQDADGAVVGSVGVAPTDAGVELKRLYVAATARRRGLGAALVGLVRAWAGARSFDTVELWSDTRFADAHRLYERCGFHRTGEQRELHDPSDTTEDRFVGPVLPGRPPA